MKYYELEDENLEKLKNKFKKLLLDENATEEDRLAAEDEYTQALYEMYDSWNKKEEKENG